MAGSVVGGTADLLRLGEGTSAAMDANNGWDIAIGITQDVGRAAGLATLVGGGLEGAFGRGGTATTTALSPYRVTTPGETFYHYGYGDSAASFQGGLRPGGFATSSGNLSGAGAQSGLALRHEVPPNAVYTVTPTPGTPIRVNPVTSPNFGRPGGLPEYQFPGGTFPGTVSGPMPIPPR